VNQNCWLKCSIIAPLSRTMIPDGGASIEMTVAAVKKIFSAYSGYQKGKLAESDQALREEVRRRARMVREHIETVHGIAHRKRLTDLRVTLNDVLVTCDSMEDDAKFSTSHTPGSAHSASSKISKKMLKNLVQHDLNTLKKLLEATREGNQMMVDIGEELGERELSKQSLEINRRMNGARNHFRERNMILDGFIKK